jgi:hypothetical protein
MFLRIAQLATISQSGGNPQFWQNVCLEQKPYSHNQKKPPDTHLLLSLLLLPFHKKAIT